MARLKVSKSLKSLINAIDEENNMDVGVRFITELYSSIIKQSSKNKRIPSASFKPSSMKCPRNMQFQIMQVEPEQGVESAPMIGISESGTDRHLRIQQAVCDMKENGYDCEYIKVDEFVKARQEQEKLLDLVIVDASKMETKLYNKKWNISFMCDGIIRFHGRYYILEIKTETSMKNSKRIAMAEEHIPQICAYYLSFEIPDVIMLYENRDTCEKKAYYVVVDDKMVFDNVISKIEAVNSAIQLGEIAAAEIGKHCNYCAYKSHCSKIERQIGDN